eukprot:TRINITY_DN112_c2_g1_i1.p1 TRINITY_DN112_c2_g1~~TRINITY_DN112_c2_g1_i1.p1  ORF type:complete len:205 (+),score=54.30 TRINITY_DN112_c2_g1_i1:50-664(+)
MTTTPEAPAATMGKAWEADLCGCFQDMGLCCDTLWCGYCMTGNYYEAVCQDHASTKNIPVSCGVCLLGTLGYATFGLIGSLPMFVFSWAMRDKARKKYGIEGTVVRDCCASFWCSLCVMCQVHRQASHQYMTPGYCCCRPSIPPPQQQPQQVELQTVQPGYIVGTPVPAPVPAPVPVPVSTPPQKGEPAYPPAGEQPTAPQQQA